MISKGYDKIKLKLLQPPPAWWRLPFAMALAMHGRVLRRCQLCQIHLCSPSPPSQVKRGGSTHWFNRLQYVCQPCHDTFNWGNVSFNIDLTATNSEQRIIHGIAATHYAFPYDNIMLRYKNGQQLNALMPLIHAIRQLPKPKNTHAQNTVIIPIPTSDERLKQRGFAPVWILAQFLSFHWQIPIFNGVHRHERQHQQGLNREQRMENIKEAFYLSEFPTAKNLIIFDDVVTTGATITEVIRLLTVGNKTNGELISICILHGH